MITNDIYRNALEKAITQIPLTEGRVMVTGASGLIGSCLIDMLMLANEFGKDFEVYAIGRSREKLSKRFKSFDGNPRLHFIEQDIRNPLNMDIEVDYIIHGASNADPRNYALYPVETMLINLQGIINVLDYCKVHKSCRMLLLSTFEVYGNNGNDEYAECDYGAVDINQVRSCYPESKRSAEILTRCYVQEYGVNASIARLCSIYGPTMARDDSKAHAQFIRNALNHENIVLKSKGEQRRTYCYVIDAVTGLLSVIANGISDEVYNISNEDSIASIAEVAKTVAEIAGTKVVFNLPDEVEARGFSKPQNCILNNDKLLSLGWKGKYKLKDGLKETIDILTEDRQIVEKW